jgi:hypothetical protein
MIKTISTFFTVSCLVLFSCSGFGPAYHQLLTDKFYLTAPDDMQQMSICYQTSSSGFDCVISETVFAAGYNDRFIIAKQHSRQFFGKANKDSIWYYIIDVDTIVQQRNSFVAVTDTVTFRSVFKDRKGLDSIGDPETSIYITSYKPPPAGKMTYDEFIERRKALNVPDSVHFTIVFDQLN